MLIVWMMYLETDNPISMKKDKKFKVTEENAKDAPVRDIEWEGEEVTAHSDTRITDDTGTGQEVVLRFFDFAADDAVFRATRPTAQQLFDSHRKGMEDLLWSDGFTPIREIEPRLLFSKDGRYYRFAVPCIPSTGNSLLEKTRTLSELLTTA